MGSKLFKYPRTYHLPWSEGIASDDKVMRDLGEFYGRRVIISEKMDGENTTLYSDYIHARSIDNTDHSSRDWVKQFWGSVRSDIPEKWRVCGENLYARHSIPYDDLPTFFMGFSIWDGNNLCLSWSETLEWFSKIGITPVKVIYDGFFNETEIKNLWKAQDPTKCEGYVIRLADSIEYTEFTNKVAKFVRKDHVQSSTHWMYGGRYERNMLAR